ncbi:MAG TPA: response regulator [Polyangiaceae bacterium]|nr:response regulator [Polyangiaceae bacterium]
MNLQRPAPELNVVAIVPDAATIELMSATLKASGDRLSVATDLTEGLSRVSAQVPDIAFVDVTLGDSAGLAVLHHVRALAPNVAVFALTEADRLDLGVQAVALGGAGVLVKPLSGDELLNALSDVRTRLGERLERAELLRAARSAARGATLSGDIAEIASAKSRREAAQRIAQVIALAAGALDVVVYLPAAEGARQLLRAAVLGDGSTAPTFCEEMEALTYAGEHNMTVVRLALLREFSGLVLIGGGDVGSPGSQQQPLVELVATQAATVLSLIGAREQSHRGAMKDPSSSAYTFAYFVDVAGREIAMARRHGRRFSLATVGLELSPESGLGDETEPTVFGAERVLGAVRDTDVLARVDANEFYLLLPETGGPGAHACRRRILAQLGAVTGASPFSASVGVATFPHDGGDLSQLLRVAKFRADASRTSSVHTMELGSLPLAQLVDALLGAVPDPQARKLAPLETPHYIELPVTDLMGLVSSTVAEATRGGQTRVLATQRAGLSVGSAVRADMSRNSDVLKVDTVDVSRIAGCERVDVLIVIAEHGAYTLVGRTEGSLVRCIHSADPLLSDLLVARLSEIAGRPFE